MPRPSKASRAAKERQRALKVRRLEEKARQQALVEERAQNLRAAVAFVDLHQSAMRELPEDEEVMALRVFLSVLADDGDTLSSESLPLFYNCLTGAVFTVEGHPQARYALKRTGFFSFVAIENDAMKALPLSVKTKAIKGMWERVEQGEFKAAVDAFNAQDGAYYMPIGADVHVSASMESPSLFLDEPGDEDLPEEVRESDARILEVRERLAKEEEEERREEELEEARARERDEAFNQRMDELFRSMYEPKKVAAIKC